MESKINIIRLGVVLGFLLITMNSFSQKERKLVRQGNKNFEKEAYQDSEISYRKALDEKVNFKDAKFNLGDALYRQDKFDEAIEEFKAISEEDAENIDKASIYHNLGNSLLSGNKIEESIEAYKKALRISPDDIETKYNLAFAQNMLKKQQEQQQQNKDQNQDQNDQNKDQQKKDQQKNDENKDQQDQNKDQQDQDQQKDQEEKKPEQEKEGISKESAERILQALENDEKKVQQKVKEQQAKKQKIKVIKNW